VISLLEQSNAIADRITGILKTPRFYLPFDELFELRRQRDVHADTLIPNFAGGIKPEINGADGLIFNDEATNSGEHESTRVTGGGSVVSARD
jgi:hypothetical protein